MERPIRMIRIEPSPGSLVSLMVLLASLWMLSRVLPVLLVLVGALIIVGTINPAVDWLEKRRMSRKLSITVVFVVFLAASALFVTMTIPPLIAQATQLVDQEPALRARMVQWLMGSRLTSPLANALRTIHSGDLMRLAAQNAIGYSTHVISIVAGLLSSVFLSLYIMLDRDRLRGGLFLVVPITHHIRLSRIMLNLEIIVGGYIRGQVVTSALMAAFVFILLSAFGASNALAIAAFAGVLDILPYIGGMLVVVVVLAAVLSEGPTYAIAAFLLVVAYEQFENRWLIPKVYGRTLRLPSSVILFSLLVGTVLLGVTGALLALPAAATALMLLEELRVELPGQQEQAKDVEIKERDERGEREYRQRAEGMPAERAAAIAMEITEDRRRKADAAPESPGGPGERMGGA